MLTIEDGNATAIIVSGYARPFSVITPPLNTAMTLR